MSGILKYSNGWGHVIMSIVFVVTGVYLYSKGDTATSLPMIAMVGTAWFMPNIAKQFATQVQEKVQEVADAPATPAPGAPVNQPISIIKKDTPS